MLYGQDLEIPRMNVSKRIALPNKGQRARLEMVFSDAITWYESLSSFDAKMALEKVYKNQNT